MTTRQKTSLPMTVLAALFGLTMIVQFSKVPVLLAEDEMDEELRSTISSDPTNRGRRHSAPATSESAPPPAARPSSSGGSGGGEDEGSEWRTMGSEHDRKSKSWSGPSSGSGWSSIQIDLTKNRIYTPKISFGANSDTPTPQSANVLKQVAATLGKRPDLAVRIEGHTDSIGYDQPNLELSQRRADRVRDILVQNGVPANRLQSVGMGDRNPVASSTTSEGQEKNRRVEFHVSGVAAAPAPVAVAPVPQPVAPAPTPAPVAAALLPPPPQPVAPAPVAMVPVPQPMVAAPAPIAAAPAPQPMMAPAPIMAPPAPAAPAPAPGLVAPPPAPFGVRTQ